MNAFIHVHLGEGERGGERVHLGGGGGGHKLNRLVRTYIVNSTGGHRA